MKRPVLAPACALAALLLLSPRGAGALARLRVGETPPPIALPDLAGTTVATRELFAGAPAAVLFWSTWSPRSAEMLEDFKAYHEAYAARGLRVVAVNIDGEHLGAAQKAAVREYAAARRLPFPVLLDERLEVFAAWGVMAHPTEVVLDAGGRIAHVLPGYPPSLREELKDALLAVLGVVPPPERPAQPAAGPVPAGRALAAYNLGRQLLAKGDTDRALAAFRSSAAEDPGFLEPALMAARLAAAAGDAAGAEQFVRQVSPEAVGRGDLRYLLGTLMLLKGNLDDAERTFRALEERLPGEGWGAWGLGLVALARGDNAAAVTLLGRASGLQRENPEAEAYLRRHLRDRWLRGEAVPGEEDLVRLFPALGDLRGQYRRLRAPGGG